MMVLLRSDSAQSICTILTCTSEDFYSNERLLTEVLSNDVLHNDIRQTGKATRS
jgi:Zn-dependent M16 (insulinase) family peptidase